ncbi:MAG: glycosyltransferase, partial [Ignavibacteria bacterium]|nr:glycosyltransferase [Ignavibacteria bacterium]
MNEKKMNPRFSIVIPTLDEEICLPQLLKDLSLQSWTDFEVIHVDGGSKDKTLEKAKAWEDKLNLRTISHDVKNVSAQRNRGATE